MKDKSGLFDLSFHECKKNVFYGCCSFEDFKTGKYNGLREARVEMVYFFRTLIDRAENAIELLDPDKKIRDEIESSYF